MSTNPIWIAGYGGTPTGGASPVWVAGYGAAISGAAEAWIAGYGGTPAAGASKVWIAGYGGTPTGGASPIWIGGTIESGGGTSHSAEALAYLARTTGGNEGGNSANIATLIDGLVADGVWAKLDCLYILAQQNQADARLNLIGTSYSLTSSLRTGLAPTPNALAFTPYVGFSGFVLGLDTGFNPSTATSPKFVQNSASFGAWAYSIVAESAGQIGNYDNGFLGESHIYDDLGGTFYARVTAAGSPGVTSPGTPGLYVGDRSSSASVVPYYNGVAQATQTATSAAPYSNNFKIGQGGGGAAVSGQTLSAAFIGSSLGASSQLALYNRLHTYMTAMPGP